MLKTHYINDLHIDKLLYKNYSNMLATIKCLAKRLYCHHKLDEYHGNPKIPGTYCVIFFSLNLVPICPINKTTYTDQIKNSTFDYTRLSTS